MENNLYSVDLERVAIEKETGRDTWIFLGQGNRIYFMDGLSWSGKEQEEEVERQREDRVE